MENKKTTAQNASVGADAGQPSVKTNTEIVSNSCVQSNLSEDEFMAMFRKMNEINFHGYLHMVSHNELLDTPYVGKHAIIDDLLYTGAYILAGTPKIGKSFLVAQEKKERHLQKLLDAANKLISENLKGAQK